MNKYKIRSILLNSYLYAEVIKIEKQLYLLTNSIKYNVDTDGVINLLDNDIQDTFEYNAVIEKQKYLSNKYPHLYKECKKIYKARLSRVYRLKKRVSKMINSGQCIFLTFTFIDGALQNLSSQTRRDYVRRFLNELNCPYVSNIDFGATNGREHYHGLVQTEFVPYTLWQYGNLDGTKVRIGANEEDTAKISRYIAKLTNHAIKETTKNSYILYSRKYK